jgi:hypothetical protein
MKTQMRQFGLSSATAIFVMLLACCISVSPVLAQSKDVSNAAKGACEDAALKKGFTVDEVVSVEPKGLEGANVVLNLSKEGQAYKLTCGYTVAGGASLVEDLKQSAENLKTAVTTSLPEASAAMNWSPLWWLLLPIIGLPLLLAWSGGRRAKY